MGKSSRQVQPVTVDVPMAPDETMLIDISEIAKNYPDFRVAVVTATDLQIGADRPPELDRLIGQYDAACREQWGPTTLAEIPGIAVWRRAYRSFGIKRTSYRSSVERLVKNVLANRRLPPINSFVDIYNAVSLRHVLPAGADDLDNAVGNLAFRYCRPDDSFVDMAGGEGAAAGVADPPKDGEVVYADDKKVLCRRWNWRQDARSLVTTATTRAVVTLQFNGAGDLEEAISDLTTQIECFCDGATHVGVADRDRPIVELG